MVTGLVRQVLAIEMLEYENKNHLAGDNKTRCENKMQLLREALHKIEEMEAAHVVQIKSQKDTFNARHYAIAGEAGKLFTADEVVSHFQLKIDKLTRERDQARAVVNEQSETLHQQAILLDRYHLQMNNAVVAAQGC